MVLAFLLWNRFGVAVRALDTVHVVGTFQGFKCRVHGLHVDAAVGELRMVGHAGCSCRLAVLFVAAEATESFVDSHRSTVVAGTDLCVRLWGVALVAKSLAPVGAYLHEARTFIHLGQGWVCDEDHG